jgi:hypothetical protein
LRTAEIKPTNLEPIRAEIAFKIEAPELDLVVIHEVGAFERITRDIFQQSIKVTGKIRQRENSKRTEATSESAGSSPTDGKWRGAPG